MPETFLKEAPKPQPFKVGLNPTIQVRAKRPVLLGHHDTHAEARTVRVEKDDVGYVNEEELARHPNILERIEQTVCS